jgi:PKHD-type hydroxylase
MKAQKVIPLSDKKDLGSLSTSWVFELDPVHSYAYCDNAFTPEECNRLIEIGNAQRKQIATVGTNLNSMQYEQNLKLRESIVSWLYPNDDTKWAFRRLTDIIVDLNNSYFKFDIFGATEGFQFTKYVAPTGHYGKHVDCGFNSAVRKLSFTLQLSDPNEYEGGELCLYSEDKPIVASKKQGYVMVFPSYVLHEVTPVTKGTRYSLVSWITGKPFK